MEKKCTKCGETKLLSEYHKQKGGKYGRHAKCKVCKSLTDKKYHQTEVGKATQKAAKKATINQKRGEQKGKHVRKHIVNQKRGKQKESIQESIQSFRSGASNPENIQESI